MQRAKPQSYFNFYDVTTSWARKMRHKHHLFLLVIHVAMLISVEHTLMAYAMAQDTIGTNQPCNQVDFKTISGRPSTPLNRPILTTETPVLPAGEIVKVGINRHSEPSDLFCVKVDNKLVEVLNATTNEGSTLLTLKLPNIGWRGLPSSKAVLELASYPSLNLGTINAEGIPLSLLPDVYLASEIQLSSWAISFIIPLICVLFSYIIAAFFASQRIKAKDWAGLKRRFLHPVVITADEFGKTSLLNIQLFWFTLIVFGLLIHVLCRTGALAGISGDILILLGISAAAKVSSSISDVAKNYLSLENRSWLVQNEWLNPDDIDPSKKAKYSDLVLTNGNFDVYRYQLLAFSLLVGVTLLISGLNVLPTYKLPQGFVTLLGMSNAVYVLGKATAPNAIGEFDEKLTALRASALLRDTPLNTLENERQYLALEREAIGMYNLIYGSDANKNKIRSSTLKKSE